jgi:hypothetical protein
VSNLGQTLLIPGRGGGFNYGAVPSEWAVMNGNGAYVNTATQYVIADPIGVPRTTTPDGSLTTEEWWAQHWSNPESFAYIPPGEIQTHTNVVNVAQGANLQTAIDGAPDNTTFVITGGATAFGRIVLTARSGMHFIAADPEVRVILRGIEIYGHANAFYYTWNDGWVANVIAGHIVANKDAASVTAFLNPKRDFLFRDIDIEGDPAEVMTQVDYTRDPPYGAEEHHDRPENAPTYMIGVKDVLFERCAIRDFRIADLDGLWPHVGGYTSGIHPGLIYASGGVEGIVVRSCTLRGHEDDAVRGFPWVSYLDGAIACVFHDNDIEGRFASGGHMFLVNDDFTADWNVDETFEQYVDMRHAKYNAVVGNRRTGQLNYFVDYAGQNLLVADNTVANAGTSVVFTRISGRGLNATLRLLGTPHGYPCFDWTVRDNVVTGGNVGEGSFGMGYVHMDLATSQYDVGARIGRATVTGNSAPGVPNGWLTDQNSNTDGPDVVSGNVTP